MTNTPFHEPFICASFRDLGMVVGIVGLLRFLSFKYRDVRSADHLLPLIGCNFGVL
jgi:hypothetical protein